MAFAELRSDEENETAFADFVVDFFAQQTSSSTMSTLDNDEDQTIDMSTQPEDQTPMSTDDNNNTIELAHGELWAKKIKT